MQRKFQIKVQLMTVSCYGLIYFCIVVYRVLFRLRESYRCSVTNEDRTRYTGELASRMNIWNIVLQLAITLFCIKAINRSLKLDFPQNVIDKCLEVLKNSNDDYDYNDDNNGTGKKGYLIGNLVSNLEFESIANVPSSNLALCSKSLILWQI